MAISASRFRAKPTGSAYFRSPFLRSTDTLKPGLVSVGDPSFPQSTVGVVTLRFIDLLTIILLRHFSTNLLNPHSATRAWKAAVRGWLLDLGEAMWAFDL